MKQSLFLLPLLGLISMTSCVNDFTTVDVTYTKATALYANLDDVRTKSLIGEVREITNPGKIFVSETLLLVGEEKEGVHVLDNRDPENPVNKLFINVPGNREFFVSGNTLYAESYYDMLKIDITNIEQPVLSNRVEFAFGEELTNNQGESLVGFDFEEVTERFNEDDDFYQAIHSNEINYFNFANQLIPESAVPASFAGSTNQAIGTVNRIVSQNEYVHVISRSVLTTFRDEGSFELVASNALSWQMETVFPFDDKLFIGSQSSMEIFDVSNPEQPQHLSSFWHATSCDPVYPVGDVAYVTLRTGDFGGCPGDENALVVLDITRISDPQPAQEIEMESPYGMSLIGTRLYVGEGENGLKIFDATDNRNLTLENWDKSIKAYDVIPHPTREDIVLIAGPDGLAQYNVQISGTIELLSVVSF